MTKKMWWFVGVTLFISYGGYAALMITEVFILNR